MYYRIVSLLCVFVLLPGCFWYDQSATQKKEKMFVQLIAQSQEVDNAVQQLGKEANIQIKKILQLPEDFDFDFYLPKELQRVTVYYFYDVAPQAKNELLEALDRLLSQEKKPEAVALKNDVAFLGEENDELVLLIDDKESELSALNIQIKERTHAMNQAYEQEHSVPLYNVAKSEKFDFLPHMGLGRLRVRHIVKHVKDESQTEKILAQIRDALSERVRDVVRSLQGHLLPFDRIGVLDFSTYHLSTTGYYEWDYVKEWKLKN